MGLYSIGRNGLNLINTNAVSYQLIKVGLEMLTKPKKPKRNGGKDKTEKAAGRWPRAQTAGCSATHGAPQCTRENVSSQRGTPFHTRENTTVHQIERQSTSMFDNMQHTMALQTDVQETVHKETVARQRTPSLP